MSQDSFYDKNWFLFGRTMMAQKIAQKMHFITQKPFQFFSSLDVDGQSVSFSTWFVLFVRFSLVWDTDLRSPLTWWPKLNLMSFEQLNYSIWWDFEQLNSILLYMFSLVSNIPLWCSRKKVQNGLSLKKWINILVAFLVKLWWILHKS